MNAFVKISGVLISAVFVVMLTDMVSPVKRWISRIHIGQWKNEDDWKEAAKKQLLRQIERTPSVPVSDNERFTIIERLKGTYTSKNLQSWQEAALLLGANKLNEAEAFREKATKLIDSKIDPLKGNWRDRGGRPDTAMLAFAILSSPFSDKQKIKPAMDSTAKMLLDLFDTHTTVPYNTAVPDIRFVDTIGMICPFLIKYGVEYSSDETVEAARRQIEEFLTFGLHRDLNIPAHCFDRVSGAPLGIYGWGRGCGWWAIGLMDSYLALSCEGAPQKADVQEFMSVPTEGRQAQLREELFEQMKLFGNAAEKWQMENGAWDRQLFLKETGETTGTAMLGWFMKKMFELTGEDKYKTAAAKAKFFIIGSTRRNGIVDYAQGDTKGVGFYSSKLDAMPAAQGFAMMI